MTHLRIASERLTFGPTPAYELGAYHRGLCTELSGYTMHLLDIATHPSVEANFEVIDQKDLSIQNTGRGYETVYTPNPFISDIVITYQNDVGEAVAA